MRKLFAILTRLDLLDYAYLTLFLLTFIFGVYALDYALSIVIG